MSKAKTLAKPGEVHRANGEASFELIRDFGIPARTRQFHGEPKYPISEMKIGDAIKGPEKVVRGAAVAARSYARKHPGRKFSAFKLGEGYHVLVRIA